MKINKSILKLKYLIGITLEYLEQINFKAIWIGIIVLYLLFSIPTKILPIINYHGFLNDQAGEAFEALKVIQGELPGLGYGLPSIGGFSLPPLYSYILSPFALINRDPRFQIIPNAIFSIATGILVIYITNQLITEKIKTRKNLILILCSIPGFWYLILFNEILIANVAWNPTPLPFFILSQILVQKKIFETINSFSIKWLVLLGFIIGIIPSLHTLGIPISTCILLYGLVEYIYRCRSFKKLFTSLFIIVLAALFINFPYLNYEFRNGFINTRNTLFTTNSINKLTDIFDIISNIYRILGNMSQYLVLDTRLGSISSSYLVTVLVIFIGSKYIRRNILYWYLVVVVISYILFTAKYTGLLYYHYQSVVVIIFLIIIFQLIVYSFTNKNLLFALLLSIFVMISIYTNILNLKIYLKNQFFPSDGVLLNKIEKSVKNIPNSAILCLDKSSTKNSVVDLSYKYILKIRNKSAYVEVMCRQGSYFSGDLEQDIIQPLKM